jgi:CBS domain-containing protein
VRVGDIMTSNPITVRSTDSVEESLQKMGRAGVRRAPVVDQVEQLIGVLSLDDLFKVIAGDAQHVVAAIRNERQTEGLLRP